jgi:hypothetical protein
MLTGNWSLTIEQWVVQFSRPVIAADKTAPPYYLRCTSNADSNGKYPRGDKHCADSASIIVIDGDKSYDLETGEVLAGCIPPLAAHQLMVRTNTNHWLHTSHSHDLGKHKWRLIIPMGEAYSREQLSSTVQSVIDLLPGVVNVRENNTWTQAWFVPSAHPDRERLFEHYHYLDGEFLRPEQVPSISKAVVVDEGVEKPPTHKALLKPADVDSQISPIQAFNSTYSLQAILLRNGYTMVHNTLFKKPGSHHPAGVNLKKRYGTQNEYVCYSHHGNDPLHIANRPAGFDDPWMDAFAVFAILEHNGDGNKALAWNEAITATNRVAYLTGCNAA